MIVGDPLDRARELLTFADGFDAAGGGNAELARRARLAAADLLELAEALKAERSARVSVQERAQELEEIVGKGAYYAAIAGGAHESQRTVIAKREFEQRIALHGDVEIEFGPANDIDWGSAS